MGFLDDVAAALGSGLTNQSFRGVGYEPVWRQLKPWLAKISSAGVLKWLPSASSNTPCAVPHYENGRPSGPCSFSALGTCLICGRPTCLHHSFVDSNGEQICYICASTMRDLQTNLHPNNASHVSSSGSFYDHAEQVNQEDDYDHYPEDLTNQKVAESYLCLGLQQGASLESIRSQHRKLSAQYHPDKATGDKERFIKIQNAFDTLLSSKNAHPGEN
jgi:hypothetical protein